MFIYFIHSFIHLLFIDLLIFFIRGNPQNPILIINPPFLAQVSGRGAARVQGFWPGPLGISGCVCGDSVSLLVARAAFRVTLEDVFFFYF